MGKLIVIFIIIFLACMWLWNTADQQDAQYCQNKYGINYQLYHSPANSSIKFCQGSNGDLKSL